MSMYCVSISIVLFVSIIDTSIEIAQLCYIMHLASLINNIPTPCKPA